MMEKVQLQELKQRSENEKKYFDIALSGTSATLVFQIPNINTSVKRIIIGYAGNSKVAIQNKDKISKGTNLTEKSH